MVNRLLSTSHRSIAIYRAYLKLFWLKQAQYRIEALIWMLSQILRPIVYLSIWMAVAQAQGGTIEGYTASRFVAYFLAELFITSTTTSAVMWEYEYRVQNGQLSQFLLQPCHPFHADLAEFLASKILVICVVLPIIISLSLVFHVSLRLIDWSQILFLPVWILALLLRFMLEWMLAMIAFWTTRLTAINTFYFALLLFCSGEITPLVLLPEPLHTIALLLPLRWLVAFPIEVLLGQLSLPLILVGLLWQSLWSICLFSSLQWLWFMAIRKYAAAGI